MNQHHQGYEHSPGVGFPNQQLLQSQLVTHPPCELGFFNLHCFGAGAWAWAGSALGHPKRRLPPGGLGAPRASEGQVSSAASHRLGFLGHTVEAPALSLRFPLFRFRFHHQALSVFTCVISLTVHVSWQSGCHGETGGQNDYVITRGHRLNSREIQSESKCHSIPPQLTLWLGF